MIEDWRYNDERMKVRQKVYLILLNSFGTQIDSIGRPIYSMESITGCAHDWVSQGNANCNEKDIINYFQAHYA